MWDADLYKRALDFAAVAHGAQTVPGSGFPYVVHVTKVAAEALRACVADPTLDADVCMTCALLHDTMEDGGVSHARIAAEFGAAVADGVRALTKDETVPKPGRMADSLRRIRAERREVWVVKLADRITNLEPPPPHWSPEKRRAYLAEAEEIHTALGAAHAGLADRLREKIRTYATWCDRTDRGGDLVRDP